MKTYIKNLFKELSLQIVFLLLIFGGVFVYAVSSPQAPGGQTTGGNFMNYFNKMLVDTGSSTTGEVKFAITARKLLQGDCGSGQVLQGFTGSGEKICATMTTPATCTSFTYTPTQDCQPNGTQTVSSVGSPSGCTGGSPLAFQNCTYTPSPVTCTSFTYTPTQNCQPNGTQTVSSVGSPSGCTGGNPLTSQNCTYTPSATYYPGCDTADITLSNGQIWSACNVEATGALVDGKPYTPISEGNYYIYNGALFSVCAPDYHLPSESEFVTAFNSYSDQTLGNPNNLATKLKLPLAGGYYAGSLQGQGWDGYYWSTSGYILHFSSSFLEPSYGPFYDDTYKFSVRCIKD